LSRYQARSRRRLRRRVRFRVSTHDAWRRASLGATRRSSSVPSSPAAARTRSPRADARTARPHRSAHRGVRVARRAPFRAPWIEYADTNEGKSISTLARALDARLAGALRERGLVADDAQSAGARVSSSTARPRYAGSSDAATGARWPLGIRDCDSRATRRRARRSSSPRRSWCSSAIRERDLMHEGQSAVDLGAAPGGWTWQLVTRGLHVTAVDNGALAPSSPRIPMSSTCARRSSRGVLAVRSTGSCATWSRSRPRTAALVAEWIATGAAASAIFNLKLPMKARHDEVAR
jgi:23S rRNA (cytidine2498-2'-O)-methyltransferase